ncbi:MAG TPA: ferredoxin [Candidatus Saccharimonadales bacterium]|jgi:ferredoxin|nr:ferredoxin [Candidatus Saccharimonadales bacterium]
MKVWIDQDLCTGDGLCTEICPEVFGMHHDGLAYVKNSIESLGSTALCGDDDQPLHRADKDTIVAVASGLEAAVEEASEECPGECIFIERD